MAFTDTLSTWQTAALAGDGPGMPLMGGSADGASYADYVPVLSALASAPGSHRDVEGAPRMGSIRPRVQEWRVANATAPGSARRNCWAEAR